MKTKNFVYFKNPEHEQQTKIIMEKFNWPNVPLSVEYTLFAYIVAATGKAKQIVPLIDDDNYIDIDNLYKTIAPYSNSERSMIRFALQCFSSSIDQIPLSDVMCSLDSSNIKVIKYAIDTLYK